MQLVDEYMQHARAARTEAEGAALPAHRHGFEKLSEGWEQLAKERLRFLEERLRRKS
jgi:hypothetical protein